MNININPISNLRYQTLKNKVATKPVETETQPIQQNYINYSNINFQAKTLKLKKPVLENAEIQKLSDKISTFLEKMPQNFNIKKPVQIKAGENLIGFTIDRTEEDKTKLIIKLKKYADSFDNWDSSKEFDEILNVVLNDKGQMIEGSYTEPGVWGYGYLFERNNRNIRRIKVGKNVYIPAANEGNTWKAVNKDERLILNNSIPFFPEKYNLYELFCELTKLNTAL